MSDEPRRSSSGAESSAAPIAMARLFERLNIDINNRNDFREFVEDLKFLRQHREAAEERALRRRTAVWTSAGAAVVSAMGVLLTWLLQQGRNP